MAAGVFEAMAHDLRGMLRLASGREPEPTAAILDSRTLRSMWNLDGGMIAWQEAGQPLIKRER